MKIIILQDTVAAHVAVNVGDVVDVSDAEARFLIAIGRAAEHINQLKEIEAAVAPPGNKPDAEAAVAKPSKRGRPRKAKK